MFVRAQFMDIVCGHPVCGSSWRFVQVRGSSWKFVEVCGSSWKLVVKTLNENWDLQRSAKICMASCLRVYLSTTFV